MFCDQTRVGIAVPGVDLPAALFGFQGLFQAAACVQIVSLDDCITSTILSAFTRLIETSLTLSWFLLKIPFSFKLLSCARSLNGDSAPPPHAIAKPRLHCHPSKSVVNRYCSPCGSLFHLTQHSCTTRLGLLDPGLLQLIYAARSVLTVCVLRDCTVTSNLGLRETTTE
jgi:hypothetical protein